MELREGELKVFYAGGINSELDNAIEKAVKKFGYKLWAGGQETKSGIRDLAFDKVVKK